MSQSSYLKNISIYTATVINKTKILRYVTLYIKYTGKCCEISYSLIPQRQAHISYILYSDISTWCYMGLLKRKSHTHWPKGTLSQLPAVSPTAPLHHTIQEHCDLHHARSLQWSPSHKTVWEQKVSKLPPVTQRITFFNF